MGFNWKLGAVESVTAGWASWCASRPRASRARRSVVFIEGSGVPRRKRTETFAEGGKAFSHYGVKLRGRAPVCLGHFGGAAQAGCRFPDPPLFAPIPRTSGETGETGETGSIDRSKNQGPPQSNPGACT